MQQPNPSLSHGLIAWNDHGLHGHVTCQIRDMRYQSRVVPGSSDMGHSAANHLPALNLLSSDSTTPGFPFRPRADLPLVLLAIGV